jgi:hypothetical protein
MRKFTTPSKITFGTEGDATNEQVGKPKALPTAVGKPKALPTGKSSAMGGSTPKKL